jgi:DHA2 family multidrug resistance protein
LLYQLSSLQFLPFLCGNATNIWELVFSLCTRFGWWCLLVTAQTIITESYPIAKRGMAQAIYGMGVIVGPTLGPPLGGYLVDNFRGLIFSTLISH